uniref:Uncharacterized protein n=1 Tax=Arundo donax TaxID=35708 RepID=A0A0A9G6Q0_ARUDO
MLLTESLYQLLCSNLHKLYSTICCLVQYTYMESSHVDRTKNVSFSWRHKQKSQPLYQVMT